MQGIKAASHRRLDDDQFSKTFLPRDLHVRQAIYSEYIGEKSSPRIVPVDGHRQEAFT
jgi:hypothetical protein